MRRTTLTSAAFALLLLMLGGVAIAGANPTSQPDDSNATTLRFDVQFSDFFLVDVGEPNLSLGDYTVFHDLLFSGGERVGDEGGTCPVVDVSRGLIHCTGTIRLSGGQITFQGLTTTAPTKQFAITGGTGRYQDASGQGTLVEFGNGRGSLTLRLRR
jgi:Allene oxide cyclase barrel like domain